VAVLAKRKEDLKGMIRRLERYVERKGLKLNVKKTKIMKFRKLVGKLKKMMWK